MGHRGFGDVGWLCSAARYTLYSSPYMSPNCHESAMFHVKRSVIDPQWGRGIEPQGRP